MSSEVQPKIIGNPRYPLSGRGKNIYNFGDSHDKSPPKFSMEHEVEIVPGSKLDALETWQSCQ